MGSRFAAGSAGAPADKLLSDIRGQTVLQRAVGLFARRADVGVVLIVTAPERFEPYREHLRSTIAPDRLMLTAGGRERWESVLFGLRTLAARGTGVLADRHVAIHDAARPLTPVAVIDAAFAAAQARGGSLPCVPEPATLKRRAADGNVAETVDRRHLYQAQTPQCFHLATLLAAFESLLAAGQLSDVTDDAQVYERAGNPVAITEGSSLNLKITTAADLELAPVARRKSR